MSNKRKIEIFEEVIKRLEENTNYSVGICHHLSNICIGEEYEEINKFFLKNKPKEILSEKFWWSMDEKGMKERISFIRFLIFIINPYYNISTEYYHGLLLSSGMFWEIYPELTGEWEKDKTVIEKANES